LVIKKTSYLFGAIHRDYLEELAKNVFFRGAILEKTEVSTYLSHGTLGNGFSTTIPQHTTGSQKTPRTKLVGGLNPFEKY